MHAVDSDAKRFIPNPVRTKYSSIPFSVCTGVKQGCIFHLICPRCRLYNESPSLYIYIYIMVPDGTHICARSWGPNFLQIFVYCYVIYMYHKVHCCKSILSVCFLCF